MKYICLGYIQPGKFENMSESERNAMLDECFTYDDELRKITGISQPAKLFNLTAPPRPCLEERQSCNNRRSVRGNEGAVRRHSGAGSAGSPSRDSAHVPPSRSQVWTLRDTAAADLSEMIRESERRRGREDASSPAVTFSAETMPRTN